jgi:hypothetical protein
MDMAVMAVTAVMAGTVTEVMGGMAVMVIGMAVIGAGGAAGGGLVLAST